MDQQSLVSQHCVSHKEERAEGKSRRFELVWRGAVDKLKLFFPKDSQTSKDFPLASSAPVL